jgi:hypothetical protein
MTMTTAETPPNTPHATTHTVPEAAIDLMTVPHSTPERA